MSLLAFGYRSGRLQALTQKSILFTSHQFRKSSRNKSLLVTSFFRPRKGITAQEADSLRDTEALVTRGAAEDGGLSSSTSVPLLPLLPAHFLHFLPSPSPAHLTRDQPRTTTGTQISLRSAGPSHLTPTLKALACHRKLRTSERVPWEEKVQQSAGHKPQMLATSGRCSLQNSKTLSNTQWGAFHTVQI